MPIRLNEQVLGCINLTWKMKAASVSQIVEKHLPSLQKAVDTVGQRAGQEGVAPAAKAARPA
jgi:IclR family mhp operon transcriptional activator